MNNLISKTGERVIPEDFRTREEYLLYLLHLFTYEFARDEIGKDSFVLEVGCGEGYGANLICQKVSRIIALDVDKNAIDHASSKYGSENCTFNVYDGSKIPYEASTFDAVISFQVIEHIQDDVNFITEINRVLKKGGVFIVATPNKTYRLKPRQKPLNEFHVREYCPEEFKKLLEQKFSNVNVCGIRGSEEVQRIELERSRAIFDPRLDPLNLRKLIPLSIRRSATKLLKRITCKNNVVKGKKDFLERYSTKDYFIIKDNIEDSLVLLGICRK